MSKINRKSKKFPLHETETSAEEVERVPVNKDAQDGEDSQVDEDFEPNVAPTKGGRMVNETKSGKTCQICGFTFETEKGFKKHEEECVEKINEFADVLEKERNAAMAAQPSKEFFKYCDPNPKNPCYCCGEDVSTAHFGQLKCKLCTKSFKAYDYLERHLQNVHSDSDLYSCTHCIAKCPSEKVLSEHMLTHTPGKSFSCMKCGKCFTRKYDFVRHRGQSMCAENPKHQIPCDVCGKVFTRMDNLREHLRFHTGETKQKLNYQCPHCDKAFYRAPLLNLHMRCHTGERPFPCDLCTKSFPSAGALQKHRRSHTGERPYRCDECSATFSAKETLNRHMRRHTGDKPHGCTLCDKKFIQLIQLRAHMFHHTGGSLNYGCDECGKMFPSKSSLKIHSRTHIVEDACFCPICSKRYIRQDCLARHIKAAHRDSPEAMSQIPSKKKMSQQYAENVQIATIQEAGDDEQTLEIDGQVFQITPLEDDQLDRRKDSMNDSVQANQMIVDDIEISQPKLEPDTDEVTEPNESSGPMILPASKIKIEQEDLKPIL